MSVYAVIRKLLPFVLDALLDFHDRLLEVDLLGYAREDVAQGFHGKDSAVLGQRALDGVQQLMGKTFKLVLERVERVLL